MTVHIISQIVGMTIIIAFLIAIMYIARGIVMAKKSVSGNLDLYRSISETSEMQGIAKYLNYVASCQYEYYPGDVKSIRLEIEGKINLLNGWDYVSKLGEFFIYIQDIEEQVPFYIEFIPYKKVEDQIFNSILDDMYNRDFDLRNHRTKTKK